jgi:cytochrome b
MSGQDMKPVLIWDLPTRLFHLVLASSFLAAWLSSDSDEWLSVHAFAGYLMLGLICFRAAWGYAGGRYARFAAFAYGPATIAQYLRALRSRSAARYLGHNPAGSLAVYLMLAAGLVVAISGILAQGGEEQQGAATGALAIAAGTVAREIHSVLAEVMLALVAGHLAGVAVDYWLTRENLPLSMLTGLKEAPASTLPSRSYPLVAALMIAAITGFALWWFQYAWRGPVAADTAPRLAYLGPKLADDPLWREECGSCHLAFHPNLLPARSWQRLMAGQASHFGSDLALDAQTSGQLLAFLLANAAELAPTEAAFKIRQSIPANEVPLRITATPYWIEKHAAVNNSVWQSAAVLSRANCQACHHDALAGTFEDAAMHLPD